MKGRFVVFYGVDGDLRSTYAKMLVFWLNGIGIPAKYVKYPILDLSPTGPKIRSYLKKESLNKMSIMEFQDLQIANQADFEIELNSLLNSGIWVVADDYRASNVAWGVGVGFYRPGLERKIAPLYKEDLAFLLDGEDLFPNLKTIPTFYQDDELIRDVLDTYRKLAYDYEWIAIDMNKPIHKAFMDIKNTIKALFDIDETTNIIKAIVAMSNNGVIGKNDNGKFIIPWKIKEDMENFRKLTLNAILIMGWNTWLSVNKNNQNPFDDLLCVVISSKKIDLPNGVFLKNTFEEALKFVKSLNLPTFVIGGVMIYKLFDPYISEWHLTLVDKDFEGDDYISFDESFLATFLRKFVCVEYQEWGRNTKSKCYSVYHVFRNHSLLNCR